jgi:hypothetical protein
VIERAPPPPSLHHPRHPTSSHHRSQSLFSTACTKLSPSGSGSEYWPTPAVPTCAIERAHPPPPSHHWLHATSSHRRPPLLFPTAHMKPSPSSSISEISPKPPPRLELSNRRPNHRNHCMPHSPPPLSVALHCRFQRSTRSRALVARFQTFGPKPAAPPCAVKRTAKPPQPLHTTQPTTSPHHLRSLFATAHPKPSPSGSVSDF